MNLALWQRLDQTARKLLPALTTLILGLLVLIPLGVPRWGALAPPLMLASVYYWSLSRPGLLPPSASFALGLYQDLLTGAPLGSGALILVVVQWILRSQQRFLANRPFILLWAGFAPVAAGAALADWVIYALFTVTVPPIADGLVRAALGFALFPVVARLLLIPAHRALAVPG
jgi:rod shape-determining protein MreD